MRNSDLPADLETPVGVTDAPASWGSDVIGAMLRRLGIEYLCINPGASFRGLHDSLVNHLGNRDPRMLVALHEEHCIAIAHGYAKASGRMMGAVVHSNVGLMHATMGIFDAWCDRMPVLVLGATGPVDAARRRPWIDWIHTARDQGALVRGYTKWDDQPASVDAACEALLRACQIAETHPKGPVYVNFDVSLQEDPVTPPAALPDPARYRAPAPPVPAAAELAAAADILAASRNPVILVGRVVRDDDAWRARIALAELLGAKVLTDVKPGIGFPLAHPLHPARPSTVLVPAAIEVLKQADAILALDWVDLAGTLKMAWPDGTVPAKVISASMDRFVHNGWSMDHQGLPPVDVELVTVPDAVVGPLAAALAGRRKPAKLPAGTGAALEPVPAGPGPIDLPALISTLRAEVGERPATLVRVPITWDARYWPPAGPMDHLGSDGGGGIGSGPGMAIGSALALQGTGRLPVAVLGDGDFLMGVNALWTATHYRIPLLMVIYNNRSYLQDEMHQERVAVARQRPVENRWIGLRISDPEIDLAGLARAQGAAAFGPVADGADLPGVLRQAIAEVEAGRLAVVDVHCTVSYHGNTTTRK